MPLIDDYNLSNNTDFQYRCQMALISTAIAIQSESVATANHAARSTYALRVLADPVGFARLMAAGFTVDGATASNATDQNLKDRASAIWNAYAVQT